MKYTKGPWKILNWHSETSIIGGDEKTVCEINILANKNHEADANLIAAAPDLLEACKMLFDAFEHRERFEGLYGPEQYAMDNVRKAIAKAEGKNHVHENRQSKK